MKGFSHFSHLLSVAGTSEWEQRSHCGCHTRSSLHSPFALPAVSPSPPTAPQLWPYIKLPLVSHAHTHGNAPTGTYVLGGFRAWLHQNTLFLPAGCSLPIRHTDRLRCWRHNVIHPHHQGFVSVTPLHTATTHELMHATNNTLEQIFHLIQSFSPSSTVSQMPVIVLLRIPASRDSLPQPLLHARHTLSPQCPPL